MFSQKFLVAASAVLSVVSAQTNVCTTSTATINSPADATKFASCDTIKGSVLIGPDAAGTISLDGPGEITGDLVSHNAGQMVSLTSSTITSIGGKFDLFNLTLLSTLRMDDLTQVGDIIWDALPALSALTFPSSIAKAKSVVIQNTFLSTLDGINLMTVGILDINNNRRLTKFSTQVGNITESLNIAANGLQLDVEFPNLIWANSLTFRNISKLGVQSLATVNSSLVFDESLFESLSLPNLTTVGSFANKVGSLSFVGNGALSNITFPVLNSVGGGLSLANNSALQTLNFPALTQVGGAVDLSGNFTTPNFPALKNVVGAMNIQSTATIDCDRFNKLKGNVVQGKENCVSGTDNPETLGGTGTSSSSSSKTSGAKSGAKSSYNLNQATIGLSVIGGLFGMLV